VGVDFLDEGEIVVDSASATSCALQSDAGEAVTQVAALATSCFRINPIYSTDVCQYDVSRDEPCEAAAKDPTSWTRFFPLPVL
jgi:hypothetical protein